MENKVLQEINRINGLMGKKLILEQSKNKGIYTLIDNVIGWNKVYRFVDDILFASDKSADELADIVGRQVDEAGQAIALRNAKNLKNVIDDIKVKFFGVADEVLTAEEQKFMNFMKSLVEKTDGSNLTSAEIKEITQKSFEKAKELPLTKDTVDDSIKTLDTFLSDEIAANPSFTKDLDELMETFKVATKNVFERKGESVSDEFLDFIVKEVKKNANFQGLAKKYQKNLSGVDDIVKAADELGTKATVKATEMNIFTKAYWNILEPIIRQYKTVIDYTIFEPILKRTNSQYFDKVMSSFESGFKAFKEKGNLTYDWKNPLTWKGDTAYIRKLVQDLSSITRGKDAKFITNPDKNIYNILWDDMVEKSRKKLVEEGNEDALKKFDEYVEYVLNFKGDGRTASIKNIFGQDETFKTAFEEGLEKTAKDISKNAPNVFAKGFDFIFGGTLRRVLSMHLSGSFMTPAEYTKMLVKDKSLKKAIWGTEKVISKTATNTKALTLTLTMAATYYIIVPSLVALVEAFFTIDNLLLEQKISLGDEYTDEEYVFDNYWWDLTKRNMVEGYTLNNFLNFIVPEKYLKEKGVDGKSWYDYILPGSLDKDLGDAAKLVLPVATAKGSEGKYENLTDKEKQEGQEKGTIPRDGLPKQEGETAFYGGQFKKYLTSPLKRMYTKDANIPLDRAGFVADLVRTESGSDNSVDDKNKKVWVEDWSDNIRYDIFPNQKTKLNPNNDEKSPLYLWNDGGTYRSIYDLVMQVTRKWDSIGKDVKDKFKNLLNKESITKKIKNIILEEMSNGKKFGEDNFKHWKKTFTFYNFDEESGEYKEVKITSKMDEVMDTIDHYRKKYDEDDSFVRAVIDVFGNKIDRVSFNKDLANLTENRKVFGLMKVLANIRESKELEIWTVKHYSDGNWELVKGSFNKKELQNVGKTVRDREKESEERKKPVDGLKKKEQQAIEALKRDEVVGLENLPLKVREKVKEKLSRGWTTEEPFSFLEEFYTKSEINTVFNDKISIYKLEPSDEFFDSLADNSSRINLKKGFCKTLNDVKSYKNITEKQERILKHFLTKCNQKINNKGVKRYKTPYNA